jgi:hypothetical protein
MDAETLDVEDDSFFPIPPILSLPEGVKKSHFHPHPVPPPSRGREFFLYFNIFTLSPRGRG